jgi:ankyrin repeat protein
VLVLIIDVDDPIAIAAVQAIHEGDVEVLRRMLVEHPGLARAALGSKDRADGMTRSLLHVVADWPGHFPRGAEAVDALVAAGADVNARFTGPHTETPLHWAASNDDVAVLDALLDAGADIEATGAVIAGGTPMADATAFGQWKTARRLLERGAATTLWEASALGLLDRVESFFAGDAVPPPDHVTGSFWGACHGGHRDVAEYLLGKGAEVNWIGWDHLTPLDAAERGGADDVVAWLRGIGGRSATPA